MNTLTTACMAAAALAFAPSALAHGAEGHDSKPRAYDASQVEDTAFGRAGDPARVTRTVRIEMNDAMRFVPAHLTVRRGETVRFVAINKGQVLHEMVIGTADELKKHAEMMKRHPGMAHDEPYMTHVKPGQSGDIVWHFTRPGRFGFACLLPGHSEAGMVGTLTVK